MFFAVTLKTVSFETGGWLIMHVVLSAIAFVVLSSVAAFAACSGDISGFWEKRPVGSNDAFTAFETFEINRKSGTLSICKRDRNWNAEFQDKGNELTFIYARQTRQLRQTADGSFVTPSWVAEHEGVKSEYRVRATR